MPFPVAAAIAAGASLVGSGVDAVATGARNKKQRAFTEYMYDKQVQTNRDFWNAQNTYNSPEAVMNRNREAGLNPVWGLTDSGGAPAGSIQSPDVGNFQYETPNIGRGITEAGSRIAEYQMFERNRLINEGLELQNANLATQNESYAEDVIIKRFKGQILGIDFSNYEKEKAYNLDAKDIANKQNRANLSYSFNQEERNAAKHTSDLKEAVARILTMKVGRDEAQQRIKNLGKDEKIKQMEIEMRNLGIQPGSKTWEYAIGMFVRHLMGNY